MVLVQIQDPASRSTTTEHLSFFQNLLNFIIIKYLKQEADDLRIYKDERGLCDLSVTGDIKVPSRSAMWTSIKELFLLPKSDNISPSVTKDKEICKSRLIMR